MSRDVLAALREEFPGVSPLRIEELFGDSLERVGVEYAEHFARERLLALTGADGIPGVLFLCVHNAGRSQMASGWLSRLAGDAVRVYSGGSEPGGAINPAAVAAMQEVGIDIRHQFPKPWSDEVLRSVEVVVTMGCGDECPYYPATRYVDWDLEDPAGQAVELVRPIRDEIERRVRGLLAELGVGS